MTNQPSGLLVWVVVALATAGVIVRPFRSPEAAWAVAGAVVLVVFGLLPAYGALVAIGKGTDVYLFLGGMMLLSETARREGLFERVASLAVRRARGSPRRLFALVYVVGVLVTTSLSNDATAVVLTPAVIAATRKARVAPLPYLFICAMVANAASFVLPISNPANLVLYGDHLPALGPWLQRFLGPSLAAIVATYVALRLTEGRRLAATCATEVGLPAMSRGAWMAAAGLASTAVVLLVVSALDRPLGPPTAIMGLVTVALVSFVARAWPRDIVAGVSWSVLPLVAGLFVMVEAVGSTGAIARLADAMRHAGDGSLTSAPTWAPWIAGGGLALVSNAINNLPAGLIAASAIQLGHPSQAIVDALLIGVDLGPNLSVTGSLATILWLTAIRREGEDVGFLRFLGLGVVVMIPALIAALAARLWLAA